MTTERIEKICYTDKEYNEAKALQEQYNTVDPKHETHPRIIVIDCRTHY